MKYRYAFLFFSAAFLFQSALAGHLAVFGVAPNLVLCTALLFAFLYDVKYAFVMGVVFGLLLDLCFSQLAGAASLSCLAAVLAVSLLKRSWARDSFLSLFIVCIAGTGCYYLAYWLILFAAAGYYPFLSMAALLPVLLPYHFTVMVLFYLAERRSSARHPQDRYIRGV
ncbi:MAG: rod shape-determining protein MreD [Bacillota bacterium]|nr:rod shape-determining protein MreD [Bacillota bacterium]